MSQMIEKGHIELMQTAVQVITDCQRKYDGLVEQISEQLWIVNHYKLYSEIDEYTSMGKWAKDKFGISPGSCSDSIGVLDRFGKDGKLLPEWKDYSFTNLTRIKKFNDEQIKEIGINATMSRSQIEKAVDDYNAEIKKKAQLPQIEKLWADEYVALTKLMPDVNERIAFINETCPKLNDNTQSMSYDDYAGLIEKTQQKEIALLKEKSKDEEIPATENEENSVAENEENSVDENEENSVAENEEKSVAENEENSVAENEENSETDENGNCIDISVDEYTDKEIIALVRKALSDIRNGAAQIYIYKEVY